MAHKWAAAIPELKDQPGFAAAFMPNGRAPFCGEHFRFADAARTLRRIAETEGKAFYEGELADRIVAHSRDNGGAMTRDDLAGYRPDWVAPISTAYRGYDVHELPPNGQGWEALRAIEWSIQKPRPRHPKAATPEEESTFKKNSTKSLPKRPRAVPTSRSRCLRPTSTASA